MPDYYLKAPKLGDFRDDGGDDVAARLLHEARIYERIARRPHPNLGGYLGCVVDEGRVVRLALKRYGTSLADRCSLDDNDDDDDASFGPQQRRACMDQVEAAATHLHEALRLAHNDISPANIMFDDATGQAVLIDFDACAPLGAPLTKGGWVTGWKGPLAGQGERFRQSSAECDRLAIQAIREHLGEE